MHATNPRIAVRANLTSLAYLSQTNGFIHKEDVSMNEWVVKMAPHEMESPLPDMHNY
jgi:hypothetical protein